MLAVGICWHNNCFTFHLVSKITASWVLNQDYSCRLSVFILIGMQPEAWFKFKSGVDRRDIMMFDASDWILDNVSYFCLRNTTTSLIFEHQWWRSFRLYLLLPWRFWVTRKLFQPDVGSVGGMMIGVVAPSLPRQQNPRSLLRFLPLSLPPWVQPNRANQNPRNPVGVDGMMTMMTIGVDGRRRGARPNVARVSSDTSYVSWSYCRAL